MSENVSGGEASTDNVTSSTSGNEGSVIMQNHESSSSSPINDQNGLMNDTTNRAAQEAKLGQEAKPLAPEIRALSMVPRFDDLLLKQIAENYDIYPVFDRIPQEYLDSVINLLDPSKIDFAVAAKYIANEKFWRRLAQERWIICQVKEHGNSWKRLFVERHIQGLLEAYYPSAEQQNHEKLMVDIEAGRPYVYTMQIHQLLSHLDIGKILVEFPHLSSLELKYGAKKLGMDYDKSLFGMQLADAMSVARLLAPTKTLTKLVLSQNLLNDESVHVLMKGLVDNCTICLLDLSRNRIGDVGAKRIAHVLKRHQVLTSLLIHDNMIYTDGAKAIAEALHENNHLLELDLSLNQIGDEGAKFIFNVLTANKSLQTLNVSSCSLKAEAAKCINTLLASNDALTSLDISNNDVCVQGGKSLLDSLQRNRDSQLINLDTRNNQVTDQIKAQLHAITSKKLAIVKQKRRKMFQKDWDECI
jgi:hypothetical protein